MDDAILALGAEEFSERIRQAVNYKEWLKRLGNFLPEKRDFKPNKKLPPASTLASDLVEKYHHKLAWNDELQEWFSYELLTPDVWSIASEVAVWWHIREELNVKGHSYGSGCLGDVVKLLRCDLLVRDWDLPGHLLPLQNGILNLQAQELKPHSPTFHLTWSLPYEWDPAATCELIQSGMLEAMAGHADRVQVLRADLKAIVTGRTEIQRYLECVRSAGTGKSTFIRLAESLVVLSVNHSIATDKAEKWFQPYDIELRHLRKKP